MKPLTEIQMRALAFIAEKPRGETCGYDLKRNRCGNVGTLRQLSSRKLVTPIGLGHMAAPQSATWRITSAGRSVLEGNA